MPYAPHPNPWLGLIVGVSASALEHWRDCPRLYRSRHLLQLPETDPHEGVGIGLAVHELMQRVHGARRCGEVAATAELAEEIWPERGEALLGYASHHARHCPRDADWDRHELELARFHRAPPPLWMMTGKIDAVWARDGILDARDYKTGKAHYHRVGDDLAARIQAWLLAPLAAKEGLQIRITYEQLDPMVTEWPDPYEPEDEDLVAIGGEIGALVAAICAETNFEGVADQFVCTSCAYRSICPDAALGRKGTT